MSAKSRASPLSDDRASHPSKKAKRSHGNDGSKPASKPVRFEPATPVSPGVHMSIEMDDADTAEMKPIDLGGINDEIVEAVIVRLQETRNRPHLVKDLATVLMDKVKIVQQ